jgi:hypothetical protein
MGEEPSHPASSPITVGTVFKTWWPLAASWLLMGFELPAVSAILARLADPTISLAAYGVIFPICLLIESPIIMLLAASTALSKNWQAYCLVRRFMWIAGIALTVLHVLLAFTPLFDLVFGRLIGAPAEIMEPARVGLMIMTPWSLSIAYRRFQQGVLIRYGKSHEVGLGTAVRLASNVLLLLVGYQIGSIPGIVVGTSAVAIGVIFEALYIGWRVHPVLRDQLRHIEPVAGPLTWRAFARFYTPLMITPLIMFLGMPMASAAMSRMPRALESLALWPVWNGVAFALRSIGLALNEVVVAMLERPGSVRALRQFTRGLAASTSLILLLMAITPFGVFYLARITALDLDLAYLGNVGLAVAFLIPGLTAYQSLFMGTIVHSHRTRGVTEAMVIYVATVGLVLLAGITDGGMTGFYVAVLSMVAGNVTQTLWLWMRARGTLHDLVARETTPPARARTGAAAE